MNTQLADLQILDFLAGNVDRHGGNMVYKVDDSGKITGIMGIDNDTSFGRMPVDKKHGAFRLAGVDQLRVITEPMAKKIEKMTPDMLKFALRGRGLTEEEMQGACDRLKELKEAVKNSVEIDSTAGLKSAPKGKLCKVKAQVDAANNAMKNVRKANNEYLQRKMREKHVEKPEDLVGRGKNPYEQKRIDYALKLRKSIQAYDELQKPTNEKQKAQQAAVEEALGFAAKRRARQEAQPQLQQRRTAKRNSYE